MDQNMARFEGEFVLTGERCPLDRALRDAHEGASWNQLRKLIRSGKVSVDGHVVREPVTAVSNGSVIRVTMNAARQPMKRIDDDVIVRLDRHVVVVNKPPGIVSVPDAHHRRGTLVQQVADRIQPKRKRPMPLGVVQRLDEETSGLIVFTRTAEAYEALKLQFQRRQTGRHYLAIASGDVQNATYRSHLMEHKNGKRSSTRHRHIGKFACTHVERLEPLQNATLIACRLETGRTHQIRIHLSEAGHPLIGDARYARRAIDTPPGPRVMLHAASLQFDHPIDESSWALEQAMPPDMQAVFERLKHPE